MVWARPTGNNPATTLWCFCSLFVPNLRERWSGHWIDRKLVHRLTLCQWRWQRNWSKRKSEEVKEMKNDTCVNFYIKITWKEGIGKRILWYLEDSFLEPRIVFSLRVFLFRRSDLRHSPAWSGSAMAVTSKRQEEPRIFFVLSFCPLVRASILILIRGADHTKLPCAKQARCLRHEPRISPMAMRSKRGRKYPDFLQMPSAFQ